MMEPVESLEVDGSVASAAFWTAAREGRLLLPTCSDCGELHWFPRPVCPVCLSTKLGWQESPGRGVVHTVTTSGKESEKVHMAYVQLDEGLLLLTRLTERVEIGHRVSVSFAPLVPGLDRMYPVFQPNDPQ